MSALDEIGIKVVNTPNSVTDFSAQAMAVLYEIEKLLQQLSLSGTTGSIDLRSLPLQDGEYQALKCFLGEDETTILINAMGPTRIYETRFHGVWWVAHYNNDDELMAEFIEITQIPEIVMSHSADVGTAVERFQSEISQLKDVE